MFSIILLVSAFLTLLHFVIGGAILYHLEKYQLKSDTSKRAVLVYFITSAVIILMIFSVILGTPWDELSLPSSRV